VTRASPRQPGGRAHHALADAAPDRPADLVVLVDSSASRALGFPAQVERLEVLLRQLAATLGADLPLRVACFDQEVADIFTRDAGRLRGEAGARHPRAARAGRLGPGRGAGVGGRAQGRRWSRWS
jgi:hypothetical protein